LVVLKDKISVLGPGLGLEGLVLVPGLGHEGSVLAKSMVSMLLGLYMCCILISQLHMIMCIYVIVTEYTHLYLPKSVAHINIKNGKNLTINYK